MASIELKVKFRLTFWYYLFRILTLFSRYANPYKWLLDKSVAKMTIDNGKPKYITFKEIMDYES